MSATTNPLDRRSFLKTGIAGATGLVIGFYLPGRREVLAAASTATPAVLNAFIQITPDDKVTILINKSEMGQGVETSLAMLAAEELGCDWKRINTEFAPADNRLFRPCVRHAGHRRQPEHPFRLDSHARGWLHRAHDADCRRRPEMGRRRIRMSRGGRQSRPRRLETHALPSAAWRKPPRKFRRRR